MKSRTAVDWLNFFIADVKDGLGPFLAIYQCRASTGTRPGSDSL